MDLTVPRNTRYKARTRAYDSCAYMDGDIHIYIYTSIDRAYVIEYTPFKQYTRTNYKYLYYYDAIAADHRSDNVF